MRIRGPFLSILLHAAVVFALVHLVALQQTPLNTKQPALNWSSTKLVYHLEQPVNKQAGGGGQMQLPPSQGKPPRQSPQPFLPPTTRRSEVMPALPVEPTIVGPSETSTRPIRDIGIPGGQPGPYSDGPGRDGGIGRGRKGGVGDEGGPGITSRAKMGSSVKPVLIYKREPEFSEEARKARLEGMVVLLADVDEKGLVVNIKVHKTLGLGLDEKAIEAVQKWRFRPGLLDGKPVRQPVLIEVNFHLL